jgi:type I restriction enzyme S subunit
LISSSTTSANTNINQESLNELEISYPCIPEQQKIASFLTTLDAKIEMVTAEIKGSKAFKQGLLQKMFV